jgi:nitroreductase
MEIKTAIESRTSIRVFRQDKVDIRDIKEMVRLAGLAPSVNNFQPWRYIAILNRDMLNKMADLIAARIDALPLSKSIVATNVKKQVTWFSTFFKDAPVLLALVVKPYETIMEGGFDMTHDEINKMRNYPDIQSAGASIQNLLLAAVDMGYGACWLSGPMVAKDDIEKMLSINEPEKLLAFIVVGKPVSTPRPKGKSDLSETMQIIE